MSNVGSRDSSSNGNKHNNFEKANKNSFETFDELKNYIKLKMLNRNYSLYLFQDRYSILFMYPISPACEYTSIHYEIMDTTNDRGIYIYTTSLINENNEPHCAGYIKTLRRLVGMNAPPNLSLMHRTNSYYMCELTSNNILVNKYSPKNNRDLIFQVLACLISIYSCDSYIDNLNISVVILTEPVNLIYKFGSVSFNLDDVMVVPILRPSNNFKIYHKESTPISTLQNVYESCASKLKSLLSNDLAVPYIKSEDIIECIFSYLLMEFKEESNLCKFEPAIEDLRVNNKFINRTCLLQNYSRGNVFYENQTKEMYVQLNDMLFYREKNSTIVPLDEADMTQMIAIKETNPKGKQATIRSFTFNCI